ncbi:hypothetical protein AB0L40_21890 [Patulibacter sp. NPDC049589]|uniref:hypothetical protein n=1 Tax=Patulibacter sp. NPDC049589 TaxID=3154731 RepID=UPI0034272E8F
MRLSCPLLAVALGTLLLTGCGRSGGPDLRFAEQRVRAEYALRLGEKLDGDTVNVKSVECNASGDRAAICVAEVSSSAVNGSVTIRVSYGGNDLLRWVADDAAPGGDTVSVLVAEDRARANRDAYEKQSQ